MDTPWRIELLGRLQATQGDRVVTRFRARRTGALLAYLAYYLDRPHPREVLIELLWPEAEPSSGHNNLSRELTSLRRQLEPPGIPAGAIIIADRASVQLNPATCNTDVMAFEAALKAATRAASSPERGARLLDAVELYRGELLPGHFEDWVLPARQRLEEAFLDALARLIAHLEEAGDPHGAIRWARRALTVDPLREETHHKLIRLLAAGGEPAAAFRQYQELERLLAQEWGATPAPETSALVSPGACHTDRADALRSPARRSSPDSMEGDLQSTQPPTGPRSQEGEINSESPATSPPTPAALSPTPNPLPLSFTRFFGREQEIQSLREPLFAPEVRLVTLIGPGGTGKTRLALETARQLQPGLAGRVWFVALLDLADPRLIADKLLETLRLPRSPQVEPMEQVVAFLCADPSSGASGGAARPSLLLFDNFEHLVEGGRDLVLTLLERVESLTVLVTSRRCLGLEGEQEFPVPPLPVPAQSSDPAELIRSDSVRLFVDRAQAVRPDFQVTRTNAIAVADLCGALEGLPLALELAAARIGVLTPQQMLDRLQRRFELLTAGRRGADPRHRSLRAALDWSYQLLPPELQRFFARLSVFRGGWTVEAAEAICEKPQALHDLAQLQECSLVQAAEAGGEMRFRLLETLREYGAEQLGPEERAAVAHRHASYYLALAERAEPELARAEQIAWLDRLERDLDNLRVALAWLEASGRTQEALRLGGALREFWHMRGYLVEGVGRLKGLLALPGAEARTSARAKALNSAGVLAEFLGDRGTARSFHGESLTIARELGDRWNIAYSLTGLGMASMYEGNPEAVRPLFEEGLALCQELGDTSGVAYVLTGLGCVASFQSDYGAAQALFEQCLTIRSERGDQWGVALTLGHLGYLAQEQAKYEEARSRWQGCLALAQELSDRVQICESLLKLGDLAYFEGDLSSARALLEQSLPLAREVAHKEFTGWILAHLAEVAGDQGDPDTASAHLEEAMAVWQKPDDQWLIAWSLHKQGRIAQHRGDLVAAGKCFAESLARWNELGDRRPIADCLEGLAAVAGQRRHPEGACRLFGAAASLRETAGWRRAPVYGNEYERSVAAARDTLGEEAFTAAWAEGRAMTPEQAVAYALA